MAVEVLVRPPTRECPGAGSHRPGVPERHAQEAVRQPQFRRWRSRLRSVDRPAAPQRRAQGARSLGGLLESPGFRQTLKKRRQEPPGLQVDRGAPGPGPGPKEWICSLKTPAGCAWGGEGTA